MVPELSPIRVFIVDDHQLIVDGVQSLIAAHPGIRVCGSTTEPLRVVELLAQLPADILITDVNMPEISGAELVRQVRAVHPRLPVIALSMFGDKEAISEMLRAGATGYVLKNTDRLELIQAIEQVYAGKTYFSEAITAEMMKAVSWDEGSTHLTRREIEIIRLIDQERSNRQIADQLCISERTVETHRKNIFRKTSTQSVLGLIKYAHENRIL